MEFSMYILDSIVVLPIHAFVGMVVVVVCHNTMEKLH